MTTSIITAPPGEPVIVITRMLDAPRALVFKMFSDPYHLVQFWGPIGATSPVCEMDFRPGGVWHQVMRFPNGKDYAVTSVYLEIVPPERIVYRDLPDGGIGRLGDLPPPQMITTISFEDQAGRTRLTAHVHAASVEARDMAIRMGFAETVRHANERLAAYLATL